MFTQMYRKFHIIFRYFCDLKFRKCQNIFISIEMKIEFQVLVIKSQFYARIN